MIAYDPVRIHGLSIAHRTIDLDLIVIRHKAEIVIWVSALITVTVLIQAVAANRTVSIIYGAQVADRLIVRPHTNDPTNSTLIHNYLHLKFGPHIVHGSPLDDSRIETVILAQHFQITSSLVWLDWSGLVWPAPVSGFDWSPAWWGSSRSPDMRAA